MSFIQMNLGEDVKEKQAAPEANYPLQISNVSDKPANSGSAMLTLTIGFPQEEDYKSFKHYITLPTEGDDPETMSQKSLGCKRFLEYAKVPYDADGFDQEALYGYMFDGDVGIELVEEDRNGDPLDTPYEVNKLKVPFLG